MKEKLKEMIEEEMKLNKLDIAKVECMNDCDDCGGAKYIMEHCIKVATRLVAEKDKELHEKYYNIIKELCLITHNKDAEIEALKKKQGE